MNEQKLQELDKLADEAIEAPEAWDVNLLGQGLRDAVAEVRRLREANESLRDVRCGDCIDCSDISTTWCSKWPKI